ncbi:phosphotransferase [Paenibacillus shunpengii]|uniref:Phosphotransferase n=1 Tax=Paenibacillus shunpengii TaxID=2054424 RepID=A0ABW5SN52_9BACL|nr:phosphotransferase [Paenibacillus sp. PDC88]SDW18046.1 Ser/Thr protein kinase RdoA involved in Cpx stress response, MazF antagonist [Paenibacillus sp. PDC88]
MSMDKPKQDDELHILQDIWSSYFAGPDHEAAAEPSITRLRGGMNNSSYRLGIRNQEYVLRLYESHQDQDKVLYEHAVLDSLSRIERRFEIPELVHTPQGNTITYCNGKIAALFRYKEGRNPELTAPQQYEQLGLQAGQLSAALSRVELTHTPVYPPYYRLDISYPECPPAYLLSFLNQPDPVFQHQAHQMKEMAESVAQLFEALRFIDQLPHQIVHGDLNASNVLENDQGQIYAILDFEFATLDARVMELAVPLSDMLGHEEEEMWENCIALISGFTSVIELGEDERAVIPLLILLRRLDVVMHFISRWRKGIDSYAVVERQLEELYARMKWMDKNRDQLASILNPSK